MTKRKSPATKSATRPPSGRPPNVVIDRREDPAITPAAPTLDRRLASGPGVVNVKTDRRH